jgi:carbonic anhydrase/acetyltransferase-like protein (isoleucine patch superfamily)
MIESFLEMTPRINPSAYVHPTAIIVGDVVIEANCSVWPYAVLRGDIGSIYIDEGTNIQEHVLIHTSTDSNVRVGKHVTVGHQAIIHGACVDDDALIGMGSILLDHSHILKHSIVGAGALVTSKKTFPIASLILGSPAKRVKEVSAAEIKEIRVNADHYIELKEKHRGEQ